MRYTGIDSVRGASVIGMIIFHAHYLFEEVFKIQSRAVFSEYFWWVFGKIVATTFIVISGYSLFLSERGSKGLSPKIALQRSLRLAVIAMGISAVTLLFFPEQRIIWGIIHFFALASLLSPYIRYLKGYAGIVGILIILIGSNLISHTSENSLLIPLGWYPASFYSADYYPIVPWLGYYLLGYSLAGLLSSRYRLSWFDWKENIFSRFLVFFGKNALAIYVLHVPIVYVVFALFFGLKNV